MLVHVGGLTHEFCHFSRARHWLLLSRFGLVMVGFELFRYGTGFLNGSY